MAKLTLSFYGAAREVTGSCFLLDDGTTKVLVDCGMFQGCDDCDVRTHMPFPFKASEVDAVFVTHAHIDHIGRLPKLVKEGFSGPIYATPPTKDLAGFMLEDAMNFFTPGHELYSEADLKKTVSLFQPTAYDDEVVVGPFSGRLLHSGHILGSAFVRFEAHGKIILFSGDLGSIPSTLLSPPVEIHEADVLVVESTYGNRAHHHIGDRTLMLERAIEDVASKKGVLMMPTFATERTQEILFEINDMLVKRRVPPMPVFVDSPLAQRITSVFSKYPSYYREEIRALHHEHSNLFNFTLLKFTSSVEESKGINSVPPPKVIIAGSGMSSGGRILHHEKRYLSDPGSILLISGYQAAGSLGRRLLDHEKIVKIHGEEVTVRAEIRVIDGYSAHADAPQLRDFVASMRDTLKRVFLVHGEPDAALAFQQTIRDHLGITADAPSYGETYEIS